MSSEPGWQVGQAPNGARTRGSQTGETAWARAELLKQRRGDGSGGLLLGGGLGGLLLGRGLLRRGLGCAGFAVRVDAFRVVAFFAVVLVMLCLLAVLETRRSSLAATKVQNLAANVQTASRWERPVSRRWPGEMFGR